MAAKKPANKVKIIPSPLFDTIATLHEQYKLCQSPNNSVITDWLQQCKFTSSDATCRDYQLIMQFLYSYRGSPDTFNAYRRELERLIQWSWLVAKKSILLLKRTDIEEFIEFCQNPPETWISIKTVARFLDMNGERKPNSEWRPFNVKIAKKRFKDGERA